MTGKVIDSGATGFLVLIIPIALVAVVVATAWPVLLALLLIIIVWQVVQQWQWQRFVGKVNPAFNRLIRENNGCVTPVDLAMKANIEGNKASKFLEYKATEFSAKRRELENQGHVYYFLTASAVENFFEEPESLATLEGEEAEEEGNGIATASSSTATEQSTVPSQTEKNAHAVATAPPQSATAEEDISLIQAELAKRLGVHSSTLGRRKSDPDFAEWTQNRDPENIRWQYSDETKLFYPLDQ
jgi:YHS domain-containing protein